MKQGIVLLFLCVFLLCAGCESKTPAPSNTEEGTKPATEQTSLNTEKSPMTQSATFKIKIEYCTS